MIFDRALIYVYIYSLYTVSTPCAISSGMLAELHRGLAQPFLLVGSLEKRRIHLAAQ